MRAASIPPFKSGILAQDKHQKIGHSILHTCPRTRLIRPCVTSIRPSGGNVANLGIGQVWLSRMPLRAKGTPRVQADRLPGCCFTFIRRSTDVRTFGHTVHADLALLWLVAGLDKDICRDIIAPSQQESGNLRLPADRLITLASLPRTRRALAKGFRRSRARPGTCGPCTPRDGTGRGSGPQSSPLLARAR